MKKTFILIISVCVSFSLCAQLKVHQTGKVGIKTTSEAKSPLTVGENAGSEHTAITATGNTCGAYFIGKSSTPPEFMVLDSWSYALRSDVTVQRNMVAAIDARAMLSSPVSSFRAIGVRGVASNATSGYNFGVFGLLAGTNGGAAVYGTSVASDWGTGVGTGRYAGYFRGNVHATGTVTATSFITPSDIKYKSDIKSLSSQPTALNILSELNPVVYSLRQPDFLSDRENKLTVAATDTVEVATDYFDEQSQEYQKKHYGLIAQELQEIMPDLVYENAEGALGVNYIELIPFLIQAMKEQQQQIEVLQKMLQAGSGNGGTIRYSAPGVDNEDENTYVVASLEQNRPNPFSERTTIEFTLPEDVVSASLYIYDLNGRQMDKIDIQSRGKSSIEIPAERFAVGMYIYTLLADNVVVGSKRMIITE